MQKLILFIFALFATSVAQSQDQVTWLQPEITHTGDNNYQLKVTAQIQSGWGIYDMEEYDGGPNSTRFDFEPAQGVEFVGETYSIEKSVRKMDYIFDMEIGKYSGDVTFVQDIKLTADKATIKFLVEWMACNETTCMPPTDKEYIAELVAGTALTRVDEFDYQAAAAPVEAEQAAPTVSTESKTDGSTSMLGSIITTILAALLALLTPCVFPMLPMTVSFFVKGSDSPAQGRFRAFMYGLFIVLLYTVPIAVLVLITRFAGGENITADIFYELATHWLPNTIFFIVFIVFAISFFGAFDIKLPSSWTTKTDKQVDKGGLFGIFFLALTLVLVSFSCTGPIVSSVIIESLSGEVFWEPILVMFIFSATFALPFVVVAFFPTLLNNLPKSGGWLNSVKVVLGFIEVALALKFLSVADLAYDWHILDREVFLAAWIVVFTLLGFYLLGKIRFAHDTEIKTVSVGRLALAITTFTFVVYMIPGMWGAPLKALSGWLPPLETQDYVVKQGGGGGAVSASHSGMPLKVKYADLIGKAMPNDLKGFYDYNEAMAYAKSVNKPLLIDFTGHTCPNCRKMEQQVWSDPEVNRILNEDYVIVAIYMDEKDEVPASEWVTADNGRVLKTLGKINSYWAQKTFGINAQPYYILQGTDGAILTEPRAYDTDIEDYVDFLRAGVDAFNSSK